MSAKQKFTVYPVVADEPFSTWCAVKPCSKQVKWKILTNFYCDDHIVHPRQLQLKGTSDEKGDSGVERQGKEDVGEVSEEREAHYDSGTGESLLFVGGDREQQAGQFVGAQLPAEAAQGEDDSSARTGAVLPGAAEGDPFGESEESDFPFCEDCKAPREECVCAEFGAEGDPGCRDSADGVD